VPLIPSTLSLRTFDQLATYVQDEVQCPPQIIAFFSMVDRRKKLHREVVEQLPTERPDVLSVGIPAASDVELMGVRRQSVVETAPSGRAAVAYRQLWQEVRNRIEA